MERARCLAFEAGSVIVIVSHEIHNCLITFFGDRLSFVDPVIWREDQIVDLMLYTCQLYSFVSRLPDLVSRARLGSDSLSHVSTLARCMSRGTEVVLMRFKSRPSIVFGPVEAFSIPLRSSGFTLRCFSSVRCSRRLMVCTE